MCTSLYISESVSTQPPEMLWGNCDVRNAQDFGSQGPPVHKIVSIEGKKYCVMCQHYRTKTKSGWDVQTRTKCCICNVPLCSKKSGRNCFAQFHSLGFGNVQIWVFCGTGLCHWRHFKWFSVLNVSCYFLSSMGSVKIFAFPGFQKWKFDFHLWQIWLQLKCLNLKCFTIICECV